MVDYFRAGGFTMWFILFAAIATVALAAIRGKDERSRILFLGAFACLAFGVLGMSFGMVAVAKYVARFPDRVGAVAEGLGELSTNGSFGSLWALAFGVGGVATATKREARAA
ncbi:MAG: hypothetical protein ACXVEF_30065 [Polyangiales bacterium]